MANGGFTNLSPTQYFDLEKSTNGEYVAHPIAAGTNWGLMLNVKKPQFQSHLVRQAINLAVDRQEIDERVFDNSGGSYCPLMGLAHANEVCNGLARHPRPRIPPADRKTWPTPRRTDGRGRRSRRL